MTDSLTLQTISTAAIVIFGTAQLSLAIWMVVREWRAARTQDNANVRAHEFHVSTMTTLNDRRGEAEHQHAEAMMALRDEREQSQRQHQEMMAALDARRQDAQRQHEEVMATWGLVREQDEQSSIASPEDVEKQIQEARRLYQRLSQ